MQTRQHLFLLGFMGCGKSYWGRMLSKELAVPFLDLDDLIADRAGKTIAEIFLEQGEPGFRALERDALHLLVDMPPSIVAAGGGTPCFGDNMDWMNTHGQTVYLNTPSNVLVQRLRHEKEVRPLLSGVKDADLQHFIEIKIAEREPFYMQAQVVLEQTGSNEHFWLQLLALIHSHYPTPIFPPSPALNFPSSSK